MSLRARLYIGWIILCGLYCLGIAVRGWEPANPFQFVVYLLCAVACSPFKVRLPGINSTLSVNFIFILISASSLNLSQTVVVACASTLTQCFWKARRKPRVVQLLFNVTNAATGSLICHGTYHSAWLAHIDDSAATLLFVSTCAYFLFNTVSVAIVVALTERKSLWTVWYGSFFWTAPQYLLGATIAGIVQIFSRFLGWQWSLLVLPAAYLVYSSYRLYLGRLEEEKKNVSEMADLHLRTIEALAIAIEAKDEVTHKHLRRVQVYVTELGKQLSLGEQDMQALRAAALLHDIGKLGVPEYILSKPGKLTPDEFERIKVHPVVGADILAQVEFPYPVVPIVAAHHEKWDGTGYPRGLRGEDIPIGARILAAVDSLDELSCDHQFRRALPLDEAMAEVCRRSGTAFDPQVVSALQRRYREWEAVAQKAIGPQNAGSKNPATHGHAPAARGFETAPEVPEMAAAGFTNLIARARQEYQLLHEVASELGTSLSLEDTFSFLAGRLRNLIPHDAIVFYVRKGHKLVPEYVQGVDADLFSSVVIDIGEGLSGWVAENSQPILNGSASVEAGYLHQSSTLNLLNSALSVPLTGAQGLVGVLTLYSLKLDAFSRDHLRLLMAICSKAALTIENALEFRQAKVSATTDSLTGLLNTQSLYMSLEGELKRCQDVTKNLAVMVLDIDHFKEVNDRYGHLTGNELLKELSTRLKQSCRESDYVARLGGDEFVVVLPNVTRQTVDKRISDFFETSRQVSLNWTGTTLATVSIGAAFFPDDGNDAESLLSEADKRMYAVKQQHHSLLPDAGEDGSSSPLHTLIH